MATGSKCYVSLLPKIDNIIFFPLMKLTSKQTHIKKMDIKYLPVYNFYLKSALKFPLMLPLPKHIFWVYLVINTFWSEVKSSIINITGWSIADSLSNISFT